MDIIYNNLANIITFIRIPLLFLNNNIYIYTSVLLDFIDGKVARYFKITSSFGANLDRCVDSLTWIILYLKYKKSFDNTFFLLLAESFLNILPEKYNKPIKELRGFRTVDCPYDLLYLFNNICNLYKWFYVMTLIKYNNIYLDFIYFLVVSYRISFYLR